MNTSDALAGTPFLEFFQIFNRKAFLVLAAIGSEKPGFEDCILFDDINRSFILYQVDSIMSRLTRTSATYQNVSIMMWVVSLS